MKCEENCWMLSPGKRKNLYNSSISTRIYSRFPLQYKKYGIIPNKICKTIFLKYKSRKHFRFDLKIEWKNLITVRNKSKDSIRDERGVKIWFYSMDNKSINCLCFQFLIKIFERRRVIVTQYIYYFILCHIFFVTTFVDKQYFFWHFPINTNT